MSILIDQTKRVIVQGITGREGMIRAKLMKDYGTNVIGGVTPAKGGQEVIGVPVFDTVQEARDELGEIDVSVLFIPAPLVKSAAMEAIEAGVKLLVIVPDRVPIYDVLTIAALAKERNARFIGPNTLGVLSPDKAVLGMMGGRAASAREWFFPQRRHHLFDGVLFGPTRDRCDDVGPRRRGRGGRPAPPRSGQALRAGPIDQGGGDVWRDRNQPGRTGSGTDGQRRVHQAADRLYRRQSGQERHPL